MANVKVYGADWCPMTKDVLASLDGRGVKYQYIDIDHDREAAKWVAQQNGGKEKKPTLDINGEVLTQPSEKELDEALASS